MAMKALCSSGPKVSFRNKDFFDKLIEEFQSVGILFLLEVFFK
jgi:hypothetical protein